MTDFYFSASSRDALNTMLAGTAGEPVYANVIGPMQDRAADPENGIPAAGDPALWYAAIRTGAVITPPAGIAICDAATGQAVLGVWA